MITLVRAELLKLRTTRLWLVLLVASVAVVGLIVVAVLASNPGPNTDPQDRALHDLKTVADVRTLLDIGGIAATLALVLGATMTTSEYRYGTAGITYLATPRRPRVVTAKMLAAVPVGALFGLIGASVPVLVALAWFAAKGNTVPLDHTIPLEILQIGLQALFGAVMGVAVGAVRPQPGGGDRRAPRVGARGREHRERPDPGDREVVPVQRRGERVLVPGERPPVRSSRGRVADGRVRRAGLGGRRVVRASSRRLAHSMRPSGRKNQAIRPPHAQMPAAAIMATRKAEVAAA